MSYNPTMDVAGFLLDEEQHLSRQRKQKRAVGRAGGSVLLAKAPFEDAAVQRGVDFVFGRPVLKSDIELAFSAVVDGRFYRAKIGRPYKGVEGFVERGEPGISIGGSILLDNRSVGTFRRTFLRKRAGIVARHDLLTLDDDLPLGIGTVMLRNTLRFELALKVAEVVLHAAWVGRYVWASLGWTWGDAEERDTKMTELRHFLRKAVSDQQACFSTATSKAACVQYSDKTEGAAGITKLLARSQAFEVASLKLHDPISKEVLLTDCPRQREEGKNRHVPACPAGKVFLLSPSTTEWEGLLRLKDGDPGFEHCRARLGF